MVTLIKAGESYKIWNINFKYKIIVHSQRNCFGELQCFFIICLLIYFKYFPSILLIYIIFEDSNVKQR